MEKFLSQPSRSMDQLGRFAYLEFSEKVKVSGILTKALFIYNFLQGVEVSGKKYFYLQIWSQYIPKLLTQKTAL